MTQLPRNGDFIFLSVLSSVAIIKDDICKQCKQPLMSGFLHFSSALKVKSTTATRGFARDWLSLEQKGSPVH